MGIEVARNGHIRLLHHIGHERRGDLWYGVRSNAGLKALREFIEGTSQCLAAYLIVDQLLRPIILLKQSEELDDVRVLRGCQYMVHTRRRRDSHRHRTGRRSRRSTEPKFCDRPRWRPG